MCIADTFCRQLSKDSISFLRGYPEGICHTPGIFFRRGFIPSRGTITPIAFCPRTKTPASAASLYCGHLLLYVSRCQIPTSLSQRFHGNG
jgi:hypothetical protein